MIMNLMVFKNQKIKKLSLSTITYHINTLWEILKCIKKLKNIIDKNNRINNRNN